MGDQLKGVLFDFDDTLIDWSGVERSWRDLEAAGLARVQTWLERRRIGPSLDLESLVDVYMRRTRTAWMEARTSLRAPFMPTILMSTLHELGLDIDRLEQADIVRAYDWNAVPGTVVFPDVPPMLDKLRAAGLKLGIVTNASQPMAMRDAELRAHGIIGYFPDCRLSAADAGYLKPHPQIFKSALERLGTAPEETVFVGDNPVADIEGAHGVGIRAVRRMTSREIMNGNLTQPHPTLHSFAELPAILDEWYPGWQNGGA